LSKAITVIKDIGWSDTLGFGSTVQYAIDSTGDTSHEMSVFTTASISQAPSYKEAIRAAVISDASSRFSITLATNDVIVLG
jgi:hypothetical protein